MEEQCIQLATMIFLMLGFCAGDTQSQPDDDKTYSKNFTRKVFELQCKTRCLQKYGDNVVSDWTYDIYDFYRPISECSSFACLQCQVPCGYSTTQLDVATCLSLCTTTECTEACQDLMTIIDADNPVVTSARYKISTPTVCCVSYTAETAPRQADLYLRWNLLNDSSVRPQGPVPVSFILEVSYKKNATSWTMFSTADGWVKTRVDTDKQILYRVTTVFPDGIGQSVTADDWTHIAEAPDYQDLHPPSSVTVTSQKVVDAQIYALVEWSPAPGVNVCSYTIGLLPNSENIMPIEKTIRMLPESKYWVGPLAYNTQYTAHLAACLADMTCTTNTTSTRFTTVTCLQATDNNLDVCQPWAPSNMSYNVSIRHNETTGCRAMVTVRWDDLDELSYHGNILAYMVAWYKVPVMQESNPQPDFGETSISMNQSSVFLDSLFANASYYVEVWATSTGGSGHRANIRISTSDIHNICGQYKDLVIRQSSVPDSRQKVRLVATLCGVVGILVLVGLFLVYCCCGRCHKLVKSLTTKTTSNPLYYSSQSINTTSQTQAPLLTENNGETDLYKVSAHQLQLLGTLGEGAFGKVVKGELFDAPSWLRVDHLPMIVAVKMVKDLATDSEKNCLWKEIQLMKTLGRHPNIVGMVGYCELPDIGAALLMDYCSYGDLRAYLRNLRITYVPNLNLQNPASATCAAENKTSDHPKPRHNDDSGVPMSVGSENSSINSRTSFITFRDEATSSLLSEAKLLSIAQQITDGMDYLAHKKFVHRDLAARNILVCNEDHIKISDFGLTRDIYENSVYHKYTSGKLPIKWMSIEAIFDQIYTTQSDVWSFGIVLYEIVSLGGTPYPGISGRDLFGLLKDGYRMERPDNCGDKLYDVMLSCWHSNPHKRPSFSVLRNTFDAMLRDQQSRRGSCCYINFDVDTKPDTSLNQQTSSSESTNNEDATTHC